MARGKIEVDAEITHDTVIDMKNFEAKVIYIQMFILILLAGCVLLQS